MAVSQEQIDDAVKRAKKRPLGVCVHEKLGHLVGMPPGLRGFRDPIFNIMPGTIHVAVEIGTPAPTLIAHTERGGNDVIVVGAHSRDTGIELLIGTVADRVLRSAAVPVLLFPEAALRRGRPAADS